MPRHGVDDSIGVYFKGKESRQRPFSMEAPVLLTLADDISPTKLEIHEDTAQ